MEPTTGEIDWFVAQLFDRIPNPPGPGIPVTPFSYSADLRSSATHTMPKETTMNRSQIEREMDALRRQLTRLEERLERQSTFEFIRDFEDKIVVSFEYRFGLGGRWYSYAALKVDDLWYTTGPKSPKGFSDDEFIRWLSDGDVADFRVRGKGRKAL